MNKQELIEKYEKLEGVCKDPGAEIARLIFLEDLRKLDEPQKPVVPKYVAKWFEEHKHNLDMSICHVINSGGRIASLTEFSEFELWFGETLNPIFTLVSMLQFGYEVEKEKRYLVKMKGLREDTSYLNYDSIDAEWYFADAENGPAVGTHCTRKELESAGFGWVFDCPGIEIEEVE